MNGIPSLAILLSCKSCESSLLSNVSYKVSLKGRGEFLLAEEKLSDEIWPWHISDIKTNVAGLWRLSYFSCQPLIKKKKNVNSPTTDAPLSAKARA